MPLTRRDFLRASSALAAALVVKGRPVFAATQAGGVPVVWLQAQGCSGCSVSLLNTIHYMTVDELLVGAIDLKYHPTVMAAAEDLAVQEAEATLGAGGYVMVVEGAIPTGRYKECCFLWEGLTALDGVQLFAQNAAAILAVGACSSFGGVVAGMPNPTLAASLGECVRDKPVINIPGCPAHPDWIVGTVAQLLGGQVPALDPLGRPRDFFNNQVHEQCPNRANQERCLKPFGCNGQKTRADCPVRQWNEGESTGGMGVNWCVGAGNPCQGCTEPDFPDGMSPFYNIVGPGKGRR